MLDGAGYSSSAECVMSISNYKKKKSSSRNKRRFSDDQIRSLEVMFKSETKLEPQKKLQLAEELGLQPRQVAIWFQNKRARWKSKHIEKEYTTLLANYNNLAAQFESLKKEKHSLLTQLHKVKNEMMMMGKSDEKENQRSVKEGAAGNSSSTDGESDCCKIDFEVKNVNPSGCLLISDDDSKSMSIREELLGLEEENELLKMAAAADSSLTSVEDWGSFDSDDMVMINNQPTTDQSVQWWDFWS